MKKYATIMALQAVAYTAISITYASVPAVLRTNGASLEIVGLFSALLFAFILSALWAPLVDRWKIGRLGRRRSWIGGTQVLAALLIGFLALTPPEPERGAAIFAICLLISVVAATQQVAVLGYMAETLAPPDRAFGATAAGLGAAIGQLGGGALALFMIQTFDWAFALTCFAVGMALCGTVVLAIREPNPVFSNEETAPRVNWSVLRNRDVWRLMPALVPTTIGIAAAYAMAEARLVDVGFDLTLVGLIAAPANLAAFSIVGPLVSAGLRDCAPQAGLRWVLTLAAFGFAGALAAGQLSAQVAAIIGIVVIFASFCAQYVSVQAVFLSLVRAETSGADLTALVAVQSLLAMPGFLGSGFLAAAYGHQAPLAAGLLGSLASVALLWLLRQRSSPQTSASRVNPAGAGAPDDSAG